MNHLVYFGESLLLPEYRGAGLGKRFFEERLAFARSLTLAKRCVFCAVIRDAEHPMRPKHYQPLDNFWRAMGFQPWDGVKCKLSWKQLGDILETDHELQFWFQDI
jgi:GNAT superfamily N-acetyltransferase